MTIGQFSTVAQLSPKALRLYDESGLLRPALVASESGYRYYSAAQIVEAEKIRLLRDMGMGLEDIRGMLSLRDPEAIRRHLAVHRDELAKRMATLQESLAFVSNLLSDPENVLTRYTVRLERRAPWRVALIRCRTDLAHIGLVLGKAYETLWEALWEVQAGPLGPAMALYPDTEFDPKNLTVEAAYPVTGVLPPSLLYEERILPEGDVALTLHVGPYTELRGAFAALLRWTEIRGRRLGGVPQEIYLNCPRDVPPGELRTEVVAPLLPDD